MKLPKGHRKCKTCEKVFRYEHKYIKRCQSCREATATGLRRSLRKLMKRQNWICPLCCKSLPGQPAADIHVDHRWPKSFGGTDDLENLQAVHDPCDKKKNATFALEGCLVVRDILRDIVDCCRVSWIGAKNDATIILDGNKRKPLCRLWAKRKKVYFGVVDENKKKKEKRINSFDEICDFAEEVKATARRHLADEQ